MKDKPSIIIYGINPQAQALCEYITRERQGNIKGFMVDEQYKNINELLGYQVYEAERVLKEFDTSKYKICLSFGYKNMVRNRREKYELCKDNGFSFFSYISHNANIYTDSIGDCVNIYPGTTIAPNVKIGTGSFLECGAIVSHNSSIGKFNFIAPGVHICGAVTTGDNCFIGGAAEIINGITIEDYVFVGAGAVVHSYQKSLASVLPSNNSNTIKTSFEMMEYMFKEGNKA